MYTVNSVNFFRDIKHRDCVTVGRDNSVDIATGWTVRLSNPSGDEIIRIRPHRPWGPPRLLYNAYWASFPRVKWPGRGVNHPPSTSAEVKERVDLLPFWAFVGANWTLVQPSKLTVSTVQICQWQRIILHDRTKMKMFYRKVCTWLSSVSQVLSSPVVLVTCTSLLPLTQKSCDSPVAVWWATCCVCAGAQASCWSAALCCSYCRTTQQVLASLVVAIWQTAASHVCVLRMDRPDGSSGNPTQLSPDTEHMTSAAGHS